MKITKKLLDMRLRAAVFSAACALVSTSTAQEPKSIASTSLCGDSYVLALIGEASPERVSALSWQSRDALSLANARQRALPQAWDTPERLLSLSADHVVFGPGEGYAAQEFLSRQGKTHSRLDWGEDFEAVTNNLGRLAGALGENRKARSIIADMTSKRRMMQPIKSAPKPKILYLSRSGGTAGPDTYVDAAITAAGGENIIIESGWLTPDPEFLISLDPDLIITSFFDDGYESVNAAPLRHKAVRDFLAKYPSVDVPGSLWPCAGPGLIEAAEIIHTKIASLP